jgi:hypothetical protein
VIRGIIIATQLEVDRILGRALLVKDRETEWCFKWANLHYKRLAAVVEICLLSTRIKGLDWGEGDI